MTEKLLLETPMQIAAGDRITPEDLPKYKNPCNMAYGMLDGETRCKTCGNLFKKQYHQKRYYKCRYRGCTNGPGTDHRVNWYACKKYEKGRVETCATY